MILVGPGLKEATENQAILHMIFEQVSSQQVLILDGGAIGLLVASQFELPRLSWSLRLIKRMGKKLSGLDLASQTEEKSREAVQSFPKGTVIVEKATTHPHLDKWARRGLSARCWWSLPSNRWHGDTLAGMIAGFAGQFPQVSLYERVVVCDLSSFSHC